MTELFNQIDQGLYDHILLALALVAALIVAIPVRKKERDDDSKRLQRD